MLCPLRYFLLLTHNFKFMKKCLLLDWNVQLKAQNNLYKVRQKLQITTNNKRRTFMYAKI